MRLTVYVFKVSPPKTTKWSENSKLCIYKLFTFVTVCFLYYVCFVSLTFQSRCRAISVTLSLVSLLNHWLKRLMKYKNFYEVLITALKLHTLVRHHNLRTPS